MNSISYQSQVSVQRIPKQKKKQLKYELSSVANSSHVPKEPFSFNKTIPEDPSKQEELNKWIETVESTEMKKSDIKKSTKKPMKKKPTKKREIGKASPKVVFNPKVYFFVVLLFVYYFYF